MKKIIIAYILGIVTSISICVGASMLFKANDIEYTSTDNEWNVSNVQSAVDDLYQNQVINNNAKTSIINLLKDKGITTEEISNWDDIIANLNDMHKDWEMTIRITSAVRVFISSYDFNPWFSQTSDWTLKCVNGVVSVTSGNSNYGTAHGTDSNYWNVQTKVSSVQIISFKYI